MKILTALYKKLKILFSKLFGKSKSNRLFEVSDNNVRGSITFNLYKDSTVDIFCYIPETKNMDSNQLTQEAESFGKFISSITDGLVSDTIVGLLDKTKKNSQDPNEQLFIENILFFWAMAHVDRKTEKDKKSLSRPIIKPTAVFSQTKTSID